MGGRFAIIKSPASRRFWSGSLWSRPSECNASVRHEVTILDSRSDISTTEGLKINQAIINDLRQSLCRLSESYSGHCYDHSMDTDAGKHFWIYR